MKEGLPEARRWHFPAQQKLQWQPMPLSERRLSLGVLRQAEEMPWVGLPRLTPCIKLLQGPLGGAGQIRANQCDFKAETPSQQPVAMRVNHPAGPDTASKWSLMGTRPRPACAPAPMLSGKLCQESRRVKGSPHPLAAAQGHRHSPQHLSLTSEGSKSLFLLLGYQGYVAMSVIAVSTLLLNSTSQALPWACSPQRGCLDSPVWSFSLQPPSPCHCEALSKTLVCFYFLKHLLHWLLLCHATSKIHCSGVKGQIQS